MIVCCWFYRWKMAVVASPMEWFWTTMLLLLLLPGDIVLHYCSNLPWSLVHYYSCHSSIVVTAIAVVVQMLERMENVLDSWREAIRLDQMVKWMVPVLSTWSFSLVIGAAWMA